MQQRWEYKTLYLPPEPFFKMDVAAGTNDRFNECGEKGWELVTIVNPDVKTGALIAVFKRPKK